MATKLGVVLGLNAVSSMSLFLGEGGRIEILADSLVQCQGQCPHPPPKEVFSNWILCTFWFWCSEE